jgi:tyrosine-specific transport protein
MAKDAKGSLFGGVLLIAGTSIGAGMLALPSITSFGGFFPSAVLFSVVWAVMLAAAFFLLEVNLSLGGEPNFISIAAKTLGRFGKGLTWVLYLLLLYALLVAYIAACAPMISAGISFLFRVQLPPSVTVLLLPLLFALCIRRGTRGIDYCNRVLMCGLLLSYCCLTGSLPSEVESERLFHVDIAASRVALPVIITSFGYQIIIPTLTTYLHHDKPLLRKTLLIGSLVPLVVYLVWEWGILGTLPLSSLTEAGFEGALCTAPLAEFLKSPLIVSSSRFFSFFAVVTSFLGVSLSLFDFLGDGLKRKTKMKKNPLPFLLTFAPPILFVFFCEKSFYRALDYAGVIVAVLLGILPCVMWLRLKRSGRSRTGLDKVLIASVLLVCLGVIAVNVIEGLGFFKDTLQRYRQQGSVA